MTTEKKDTWWLLTVTMRNNKAKYRFYRKDPEAAKGLEGMYRSTRGVATVALRKVDKVLDVIKARSCAQKVWHVLISRFGDDRIDISYLRDKDALKKLASDTEYMWPKVEQMMLDSEEF